MDEYYWSDISDEKYYADVPLLIGSNSDEGTVFSVGVTEEIAEFMLQQIFGEQYPRVKEYYSSQYKFPQWFENAYGDSLFGYQMYRWAKLNVKRGNPTYLYYFDRAVPEIGFGAFHTSELEYFYDTRECSGRRK